MFRTGEHLLEHEEIKEEAENGCCRHSQQKAPYKAAASIAQPAHLGDFLFLVDIWRFDNSFGFRRFVGFCGCGCSFILSLVILDLVISYKIDGFG